ncbi:MATE family efflux transporter [Imperialibacter roseus]|uniref:Multidrug-efflux transporter n=1 Tax=Imperialibacter roseus TaxID=1324217 RepID=A0ABZ0IJ33_9BACT|nr:MATE family efflux transporter [Imperialibacter roseus]WOK05043.1 MATE family efflux transporter [Imperialibacter roseus]|tara:strand:+ start:24971 stop:26380 length:1410 start_codon:yes stop_codon:yes gene_type:complete
MANPYPWSYYLRNNIKLAYPVMLSQLGHISVSVADSVMVGQIGALPLAAASLGNSLFAVFMLFGIGVSYGITPLVASAYGEQNAGKLLDLLRHGVVSNFLMGLFLFGLIVGVSPILYHLDQEADVVENAIPYLGIIGFSIVPLMVFQAFRQFTEGLHLTRQAMTISIIGNLFNIFLNYLLIYGKWGFPALGLNGAAIATLVDRVLMAIAMGYFVFRYQKLRPYTIGFHLKNLSKAIFKKLLALGIPSGMQFIFEVGAFAAAAIMIGWLGANALAAHQIALNLAGVSYMAATGIAAAASIRVGFYLGQNDYVNMRMAGMASFIMAMIFMTVCGITFVLGRNFFPSLYIDDAEVISLAAGMLVVAAFFQISDGVQVVGLGVLRGLSDVKVPTLVTLVAYWVIALPTGYVLGFVFDLGTIGVWIGLLFGLSISAVANFTRFKGLSKRLRTQAQEKAAIVDDNSQEAVAKPVA